jgi:hypothetical protein
MFFVSEQFPTASKAYFEGQLAVINAVTSKALEGVATVTELNINAFNASLAESADITRQLLSAKDPQEFFILSLAKAQPNAESESNNASNSRIIGNLPGGMTGTLSGKEREYTLVPQPKRKIVQQRNQTFWGMTSEEWMSTSPLPAEIFA